MTPKDFLHHCIEQYILTPLTEAGFTYHKSKYSFTKTVGDFQQEIEFCKIGNTIDFYIKFKVYSLKTFANYKKQTLGVAIADNLLICLEHRQMQNWFYATDEQNAFDKLCYRLSTDAIVEVKMPRILQNIQTVGIDFLNNHCDFGAIAETMPKHAWTTCHIADMYFLSGDKNKALAVLKEALNQEIIFNQAEIIRRIERFSGEKIAEKPQTKLNKEQKELHLLAENVYYQRLINNNHCLDENALTSWIDEACRFFYLNFNLPNLNKEDWINFDYEGNIATLFLRVGEGLKHRYAFLSKSEKLQKTMLAIFDNPIYQPSGHYVLIALQDAKMDNAIKHIVDNYPKFWQDEHWAGTFLDVVYTRKIKGYRKEAQFILENFGNKRGWTATKKQAEKYLEKVDNL